MPGIYQILNVVNGKTYVGCASNFRKRFAAHKSQLRRGKHKNLHLQRSWNKYGEKAFVFLKIETCTKETLVHKEQFWMDALNVIEDGYNICPIAESIQGRPMSDETRQKISRANKGKPGNSASFRKGHQHSPEVLAKISKKLKGRPGNSGSFQPDIITFNGKTQTRQEWADQLGITVTGLGRRLRNWPLALALTAPKGTIYGRK